MKGRWENNPSDVREQCYVTDDGEVHGVVTRVDDALNPDERWSAMTMYLDDSRRYDSEEGAKQYVIGVLQALLERTEALRDG